MELPTGEQVNGRNIRQPLMDFILRKHPDFNSEKSLSVGELNHFREQYIADFLQQEMGALTALEEKVIRSMHDQTILSRKPEEEEQVTLTFGQRVADHVASFGGSWTFIILFGVFLLLWITLNVWWLANSGFDPYPFILLNLILSCIAALQAPVIMMSQNRQEQKDRERAKKDYMINLKSELEIRVLHEKMDHLIMHQQQELLEIQRVQIEMMNDILRELGKKS
ncbi:MAG: DUF1003 domain-containing protein [Bacteroidota bacterium]